MRRFLMSVSAGSMTASWMCCELQSRLQDHLQLHPTPQVPPVLQANPQGKGEHPTLNKRRILDHSVFVRNLPAVSHRLPLQR